MSAIENTLHVLRMPVELDKPYDHVSWFEYFSFLAFLCGLTLLLFTTILRWQPPGH